MRTINDLFRSHDLGKAQAKGDFAHLIRMEGLPCDVHFRFLGFADPRDLGAAACVAAPWKEEAASRWPALMQANHPSATTDGHEKKAKHIETYRNTQNSGDGINILV